MNQKITEIVEKMVLPILKQEDLELVDIEYKKEGSNWFLRIFIDKEQGVVDLDDCSKVSELLSKELDKVDPIANPYFLEVSSPGAERPLKNEKDLRKAIGKHVHITTYEPIENQKVFEGELLSFENEVVTIKEAKKVYKIPYKSVASARLAIVF
ncbi:ribosome maturation factor RimP [Tepidibacillus fermentans]|uniref:Ribosome maturation factor RimP n=1 Tax=Tepidibacillus fermentans TaxID=1281767 RepID=A0A4R3KIR1_9BACI|nr:ribosome maturation factor RimP [Tepidibacillus fermentans]TCS82980.1 ribosome maturation factor RimP [Tepidibacillus fermentans]